MLENLSKTYLTDNASYLVFPLRRKSGGGSGRELHSSWKNLRMTRLLKSSKVGARARLMSGPFYVAHIST